MATENPEAKVRFRVNVTRLAKGGFTHDSTCEIEAPVDMIGEFKDSPSRIGLGKLQEAALEASAELVAMLEARYPNPAAE
ncbi:MAG: hypothetical protein QGI09_11020 [Dehalococcoidia bacterium]|jgi:hypothetical protein|nr:hypothetical protein [Dehalococcoidia bacterium]|tara:strand:- start:75 stop:314 length:240 start_codon:yes stop_codon:yes gene_type:complete